MKRNVKFYSCILNPGEKTEAKQEIQKQRLFLKTDFY